MTINRPLISARELAAQLDSENDQPHVIDVTLLLAAAAFDGDFRSESGLEQWKRAHIPGSFHVAIDEVFSEPDAAMHDQHLPADQLANALAGLGIAADDNVVVYDTDSGLSAARAWFLLSWIGVAVRVLDGGFAAWIDAGQPTATATEAAHRVPIPQWIPRHVKDQWIEREDVVSRDGKIPLVCGLGSPAFNGTVPTRYARRGRIPGSVNVPARQQFSDGQYYKTPAELRALYAAADIDLNEDQIYLYCGGGISASSNALALAILGYDRAKVYDGSLEEWSSISELPLEVERTVHQ